MGQTRLPTNYNNISGLTVLSGDDLLSIEIMAKTLTLDEALDAIFLSLDDLDTAEVSIVNRVWRRGRNKGIQQAGDSLFKQMNTRTGTAACLEYLKQMSQTFALTVTPTSSTSSGFSFNVFPPGSSPEIQSSVVVPIKGEHI